MYKCPSAMLSVTVKISCPIHLQVKPNKFSNMASVSLNILVVRFTLYPKPISEQDKLIFKKIPYKSFLPFYDK
jgi:hypothetical protein